MFHSRRCIFALLNAVMAVICRIKSSKEESNSRTFDYAPPTSAEPLDRVLYPVEVWLGDQEVCQNGPHRYGACKHSKFPTCPKDHKLCFRRARRKDKFYNNNPNDPYYYIDYTRVYCREFEKGKPFNCSSCTPGTWCPSLNRCTWRPYDNCPDDHRYKAKQAEIKRKKRLQRKKKRQQRRQRREDRMNRIGASQNRTAVSTKLFFDNVESPTQSPNAQPKNP